MARSAIPQKSVQPSAIVSDIANGDADQHGDVLHEAAGEFDYQQDHHEHAAGDSE